MIEKQTPKTKKNQGCLQDKIFFQVKRIEELLKTGDIPWTRVKSAYNMCQQAIAEVSTEIVQSYPFKQYLRLCQIIFGKFFHFFQDDNNKDLTYKIQANMLGQQKSILDKLGGRVSDLDIKSSDTFFRTSLNGFSYKKTYEDTQIDIQTDLKEIFRSFERVRESILQKVIKFQNSEYILSQSQSLQLQINKIFGSWGEEVKQKNSTIKKSMEHIKHKYEQVSKAKQQQNVKSKNGEKEVTSHCATQTIDFLKLAEAQWRQKESEFSIQKQRFIRITIGYEKEINELKKYNKSLRNSNCMKLEEYERNISEMNSTMKQTKNQFRNYLESTRNIQQIFLNVFQKHQKAKTPFIPKAQIVEVYESMRKNTMAQNSLFKFLSEDDQQPSRKQIEKEQTREYRIKKQVSTLNNPLTNIADSPSRMSSFCSPNKIRSSIRSNLIKSSSKKDLQEALPILKVLQNKDFPQSKGEVKSLHCDSKLVHRTGQNTLCVPNGNTKNYPRKSNQKNSLFDERKSNINSLYIGNNGSGQVRIVSRESLRPIDQELSRQNSPKENIQQYKQNQRQRVKQRRKQAVIKPPRQSMLKTILSKKSKTENDEFLLNDTINKESGEEQSTEYIIKVNSVDQKSLSLQKKKISIDLSRVGLKNNQSQLLPILQTQNNYKLDGNLRHGRESKSLHLKRQVKKQNTMNNFEKQADKLIFKYEQKLDNKIEIGPQIQSQIQEVKKYHAMACTKTACHHLRKFYDRLKKLRCQQSNKKPLKVARLYVKHST